MHLEILVEDQSGKKALDVLVPKFIGPDDTFKVIAYKGIGQIPRNMKDPAKARNRILLENLPKLLRGYGRTFQGYPTEYRAAIVLVCDLDDRHSVDFIDQLEAILGACDPKPNTRFCLAVEEGEAWLLGDVEAILAAYPKAHRSALEQYVNDSICGTWETLANAVYPGGAKKLIAQGWHAVGTEKSRWAEAIAPRMDIGQNRSPSFRAFHETLKLLIDPR